MPAKPKRLPSVNRTFVEPLLDCEQLAELLNVTPRQIQDWRYEGVIPHLRLGHRTVRFEPSRVMSALRRREIRETQ